MNSLSNPTSKEPQYSFARRLLFPYSGEEALTLTQMLRVILTWAFFFAFSFVFCSLPIMAIFRASSLQKVALLLLIVFLSGAIIFGLQAWFVVVINNHAARIRRQREVPHATDATSTSGGRYGS